MISSVDSYCRWHANGSFAYLRTFLYRHVHGPHGYYLAFAASHDVR
ncbi:MAG: hypothetical protein G01um1014106_611 [Parcubacteria group bacterium Gr01-1014_106]|nr:MAG: hypothetical protein G01um1014106_611 [Parcubacteria group bacterium Gr01-1014_106]